MGVLHLDLAFLLPPYLHAKCVPMPRHSVILNRMPCIIISKHCVPDNSRRASKRRVPGGPTVLD